MKEYRPHNFVPGEGDALTSQPHRSYASGTGEFMASSSPTPEIPAWEIDELTGAAPSTPQPATENMRQMLDVIMSQERAAQEANLGRELTPQEQALLRNRILQSLVEPRLENPASSGAQSPESLHRQFIDPRRALADDDELTSKERKELNKSYRQPNTINELVRSIAEYEPEFQDKFPLFKKEGTYIDEDGKERERTVINEANFLRWIRKRMVFFEGEDGPDTPVNYFAKVGIPFGNRHIHMSQILEDDEKFFTDQDGAVHAELAQQIRRELFVRMIVRGRDITYRTGGKGMSDEGGIDGVMQSIFKDNNMTRNTWNGKSMWHWLLEMPMEAKAKLDPPLHEGETLQAHQGHEGEGHHEHRKYVRDYKKQDTRMGQSIATAIAAYYHLADYEKLQEMIGGNSDFFTRKGFERVRSHLAGKENESNRFSGESLGHLEEKYISNANLDTIFGPDGKVKNREAFIKYMNIFPQAQVDPRVRGMVRGLIQDAIGHKYHMYLRGKDGEYLRENGGFVMDTDTTEMAEDYAFLTTRWTGIATRNDLGGTAYDAQAKWLRFQNYRKKLAGPSKGGMFGNMYNVGLIKTLGVNYLDSIRNQDGKLVREIIEDLARITPPALEIDERNGMGTLTEAEERKVEEETAESRRILSELTFPDLSEVNLYNNGIFRWVQEYKSFIGADELHLDKIVEQARFGGILYDPASFGQKIQEGFLKPLRYGYQGWPNLYSKQVRDIVEYDPKIHQGLPQVDVNGTPHVFADMSLADSMFGHELIDREQFWMRLPQYDKDGKEIKDKDGNPTGKVLNHVVDPRLIDTDKGRIQMFKQIALGRVAADIYSHIDHNSPYPKWDGATIEAVIRALEIIPGDLLVDENDLKNTVIPGRFFTREDIKWLRSIANVGEVRRGFRDGGIAVAKTTASTGKNFFKALLKSLK